MVLKRCAALAGAVLLAACLPLGTYAKDLEDYYLDDDVFWDTDYGFEEYYSRGFAADETGPVKVDGGTVKLGIGETKDLSKDRIYASADEDLEVSLIGGKTWLSGNTRVATVDQNGVVTAHQVGSAHITVSYTDNRGYMVNQVIRVQVDSGITLAASATPDGSFELREGRQVNLAQLLPSSWSDGQVVWRTSKEKIATVDDSGTVMAQVIGGCTIEAVYTAAGGGQESRKFSVRVTSALLEDTPRSISVSIPAGQSVDLLGLLYPQFTAGQLRDLVCSADGDCLRLDGSVVTAVKKGSGTATVSQMDGYLLGNYQIIGIKVI